MKCSPFALAALASGSILSIAAAAMAQGAKPAAAGPAAPAATSDPAATYKAMFTRYCVACHNTKALTAGLGLSVVALN